jgi:hypothetical protein
MPNLWSAVLLLGAGGSVAAGLADEHARPGPGALALVALAAFVRPPDALLFLVGLLIALVWLRARPAWLAAVAIAVAVGVLPWLLELAARAGSFAGALDEARRLGHVTAAGGLGDRVLQHLALTDGPALGPDPGAIPWGGVVWWLALLVLAARSPFRRERAASVGGRVAVSTGSVLLGGYVLLVAGLAPRFLLPAIALLVVAAVLGAAPLPAALRATLVVGLVAWGVWQAGVAADVARRARDDRASAAAAGEAVARAAEGGPCQVLATDAYPQIGYASGCEATWLHESAITVSGSLLTFVVVPSDEPVPSGLGGGPVAAPAGWTIVRLER